MAVLARDEEVRKVRQGAAAAAKLADDFEQAVDLLDEFCEKFYWIADHPDFQQDVRKFLRKRGHQPRPVKG